MGIFDFFGGILIGAIIDPTSSYEEMQNKIESNKEKTISDKDYDVEPVDPKHGFDDLLTDHINDFPDSESVEPEGDFDDLLMDIMNDYDNNPDTEGGDVFVTDDNDG